MNIHEGKGSYNLISAMVVVSLELYLYFKILVSLCSSACQILFYLATVPKVSLRW